MSKRKAAALSPPPEQTANEGGPRRSARLMTAAPRRDEQPVAVAAATAATQPTAAAASVTSATAAAASVDPAHDQQPTAAAAADSSAAGGAAVSNVALSPSPFVRLAAVELQLVMHGCDRRALMALARCSRSTLAAAAHPFAWRSLPLRLHCSRPSELTAWRPLQSAGSLLRHADLNVHWTLESAAAATAEEVAAALELPRLRSLVVAVINSHGRPDEEPILDESASIQLVNALRSQLDGRRPSSNFVLGLSLCYQQIGAAGAAAVADLIEHSQSLTRLDLEGNKAIQGDALTALAVATGLSSSLRSLDLSACGEVNVAVATALGRALTQSRSLTELELCSCGMDAAAVKALSFGVRASSSLQLLHLSSDRLDRPNLLGDDGIAALAAAVAESRTLTELELFGCNIAGDGMIALTAALQQCSSMRRLFLDGNTADGAGVVAMCRLLSSGQCNLALLDLTYNTIGDADVAALAEALQFNTSLTDLCLPHFGDLAVFIAPLAVALQRSGGRSALRTLILGESAIGPSGVTALSDLLRSASALRHLRFGSSSLSVTDAAALAPAIGLSSLTHLTFSNNESLADAGLAALVPGLRACPGLRHLDLWECGLTPASAANLVRIVQQCRALELLQLGANKIGDDGFCAIFAALHSGSSLRSLLLNDNEIGMRAVAALADALSRGWNPTKLEVDSLDDINESVLILAAALEQCGPALRLQWLRMWSCVFSIDAAVALVRAVHRIPTMRVLDLWLAFSWNDHAALSAVRTASSACPEVAVCLLDTADDADDAEAQ